MKSGFLLRAGLMALLALTSAGCADDPTIASVGQYIGVTPPPRPAPPDPKTQMAALEKRIEELIETKRHEINPQAKPLVEDSELVGIARKRSTDMAEKKYLANAMQDGSTSATILMDQDALFQGLLGENVAAQYYVPETGVDVEIFAQRFVASWMDSPKHKENLSFADYDRTGVGAAVNGEMVYVTELFSTDLGMGKYDPKSQPPRPFVTLPNPQAAKENSPAPVSAPVTLRGSQDTPARP